MSQANKTSAQSREHTIRAWMPALLLLVGSLAATGWLQLRPQDDREVAAVFPPWWDAARATSAVAAADGAVLGWGRLGSIVLTRSDRPGFADRLHAAGAVLLIEPLGLRPCGTAVRNSITGQDGGNR